MNQATFDVISYNIDNYTDKNYRTESSLIDDKYIMITVSGFTDTPAALEYYRSFNSDRIVRNTSGSLMTTFVIGVKNLETLGKDKNPERYRLFFNENYLKNEKKK
jgi:hypothetical protein